MPGNDNENLTDEYVVFENARDEPLDMGGWTARDTAEHTYTIPAGFTLGNGARVTLYTGTYSGTVIEPYWGAESAIWNNSGDTITVVDGSGAVVLEREYS